VANAVVALLDEHVEAGRGRAPAVVGPDGAATYEDLLRLAGRAGHGLRALGVEPEQRVAILLSDGVPWAAVFLGILRIGAVAVPLNTRLSPALWLEMVRDSRARVLVAEPSLSRSLGALAAEMPGLHLLAPAALLAGGPERLPAAAVADDDMAVWLYTSGTTGRPKAAVHVHRNLLAGRPYGVGVLGAGPEDRTLATSRLFFAYALGNALLNPLLLGGTTILDPGWPDPRSVAVLVRTFRPTLFFSVPTFYARVLASDLPGDTFAGVRCAVSAGERLPPEVAGAMAERFGLEVLDGLGATETIFMVLSNRPGRSRPGSAGTPVPSTAARLLDEAGGDAPDGAEGTLAVKTPSAAAGYWRRLDESRRAFVGEWFHTGDVFVRDTDGFYHHRGRRDDRFKVAGLWVAPADVEAALLSHPAVVEAAVVGAEEKRTGLVKAFAFVVARDGAGSGLETALARAVEERLAPHQRPRRVFVVPELPRTATGKVQRFVLRDWVADRDR
jgi:benzoate-CoA ligase family protein